MDTITDYLMDFKDEMYRDDGFPIFKFWNPKGTVQQWSAEREAWEDYKASRGAVELYNDLSRACNEDAIREAAKC